MANRMLTQDELQKFIGDAVGKQLATFVEEQTQAWEERERSLKASVQVPPEWVKTMFDREGRPEAGHTPIVWEKGQIATGVIRALAAGKADPDRAQAWVAKHWAPENKPYAEEVTKALLAGDATSGGFLIPTILSQDIIELLRPMAVVRRMGPVIVPMPSGTVRIPKLTAGSAATYIGETQNIARTQPVFGQVVLTYKKLAALVPVSNDLLRQASLGTDNIVRNDLVRAIAQREDQAFIRDDGTSATPKGLRFWAPAANLVATAGSWSAGGGVGLTNCVTDLGVSVQTLKDANVPFTRPGWLMAPRTERILMTIQNTNGFYVFRAEMLAGKLWGIPYATTTQIPTNLGGGTASELYLVDFDDMAIGESLSLSIDASTEAAYDDNGTLRSAYSLDQTVIRAIVEHDFAARRDQSIMVITGLLP